MFCCTFDTDSALAVERMPLALNMHLPDDVAVYACREMPLDFHPRYAAKGKRYTYRIWNSHCRNPFIDRFAVRHTVKLDAELLDGFAKDFVGTHDFSAFCAAGADTTDAVRTVKAFEVKRDGDMVTFSVEADGFLYNMVRIMVGTLLDMAAGRLPQDAIKTALEKKDRSFAGATAPAKGLRLEKVLY
jgi:tRNA pseudouridine38-40 synthase